MGGFGPLFRQDNMAQIVGYYEDFKTPEREAEAYSEGPFVIVHTIGGWRIECELKGHYCPALPDLSIYRLYEGGGFTPGKYDREEDAAKLCDWLNRKVKEGRIICHNGNWIADGAKETRVLINGRWVVQ